MNPSPDSKRRLPTLAIAVIAAVVLALLILPVAGLLALKVLTDAMQPAATRQSTPGDPASTAPAGAGTDAGPAVATPEDTPTAVPPWQGTTRLNILLLGIDARPTQNPKTANTDTMIVLTVDPRTHSAGMLSIPRDLWVPLPGRAFQDRINTAMAIGGPAYSMRTVESTLGIPIQHYVRVNFETVTTLVDLVGGIDVYVDQDIDDPLYPNMNNGFDHFVISKGWHHMDGATALKYARTRHGASDFYRIRRQQQIIMALRDRVLNTNAIPQLLPKVPMIVNALSSSIATDLSVTEMIQLVLLARDLPADKITRVVVDEMAARPTTLSSGAEVLLPNRDRIRLLASQLYLPPSATGRVALQNATLTKGLAAATQTYLQHKGYTVVQALDLRGSANPNSIILTYGASDPFAQQLAAALGLPTSAISATYGVNTRYDALVVLGNDYQPQP